MIQVCCLSIFTSMVNQFSTEISNDTSKARTTDAQRRTIRKAGTARIYLRNGRNQCTARKGETTRQWKTMRNEKATIRGSYDDKRKFPGREEVTAMPTGAEFRPKYFG
jgi:hypothetical protein